MLWGGGYKGRGREMWEVKMVGNRSYRDGSEIQSTVAVAKGQGSIPKTHIGLSVSCNSSSG